MLLVVNPDYQEQFLDLIKDKQVFENIPVIYNKNIQGCILMPKSYFNIIIKTVKEIE